MVPFEKGQLLGPENLMDARKHTEILIETVQKLSLAKDLPNIMRIVRKAARLLTDSDGASFVLKDKGYCYYADEDAIAPLWKGKRFPMSSCVSGWVMEQGKPAIIPDIYVDPRVPIAAYRPTFVKSMAMMPVRTASPVAAIGIYWAEKHLPSEQETGFLKALADSTSVAMENIQLQSSLEEEMKGTSAQLEITRDLMEKNKNLEIAIEELNRRTLEMQWLRELSAGLQSCLYMEEASKLMVQYVNQLLPKVAGCLYLMHPSHNYLEALISWNHPLQEEKLIKSEECIALRQGKTWEVEDPRLNLGCSHCKIRENAPPYTCMPMFAQSDITGLVYLEWKMAPEQNIAEFSLQKKHDHMLAGIIVEQLSVGISNILLRERLRNQSFRDTLTDLYNRRYLEETLERELSRCARKKTPLALLMLDVDHFKQFNDNFGHDAGDLVLQAFAKVLKNFVRKGDIPCRYGGEEFILVIPEINQDTVIRRTETLLQLIRDIQVHYGGASLSQITASIGIAMFPEHGENIQDLISVADLALYKAKNTGRNQALVYEAGFSSKTD